MRFCFEKLSFFLNCLCELGAGYFSEIRQKIVPLMAYCYVAWLGEVGGFVPLPRSQALLSPSPTILSVTSRESHTTWFWEIHWPSTTWEQGMTGNPNIHPRIRMKTCIAYWYNLKERTSFWWSGRPPIPANYTKKPLITSTLLIGGLFHDTPSRNH